MNLQPFDILLLAYPSNLIERDLQQLHRLLAHEFLAVFEHAAVFADQLVVICICYLIH